MKSFIVILLALTFIANCQKNADKQTIEEFLNYLYETRFFDLFFKMKKEIGDEAAFFACEEFLFNKYCEEVVRIYMPTKLRLRQLGSIILEKLIEFFYRDENLAIIKENNIDETTLKEIILRIEKRFQKN